MKAWLEELALPGEVHRLLELLKDEHLDRVACMSAALAAQLGTVDVVHARLGGLLHDVGKLSVPSRVLNKEGPLNAEEWSLMRRHPEEGVYLLLRMWPECPPLVMDAVQGHHEREGGGGYPCGHAGPLSPLTAVVAVADVWDALSMPRAYRTSVMQLPEVLSEMRRQRLPECVVSAVPLASVRMERGNCDVLV